MKKQVVFALLKVVLMITTAYFTFVNKINPLLGIMLINFIGIFELVIEK